MSRYDPERHHRRSIRLKGYDYGQPGAYFITLCTHERAHLFGQVVGGEMVLNEYGEIARACWLTIPDHFPHAELDEFVILPNHVHGIIWIVDDAVGAKDFSPLPPLPPLPPRGTSKTIGSIVRGFKIGVTKWMRQHTDVYTIWQRNYYEHIIRDETALNTIRCYIIENPMRWHLDQHNPHATSPDPIARDIWYMLRQGCTGDLTGGPRNHADEREVQT